MYYVIKTFHQSSNGEENINCFEIRKVAVSTDNNQELYINDSLTYDTFETFEEARQSIIHMFGVLRDVTEELRADENYIFNHDTVAIFKDGKYPTMDYERTIDVFYDDIKEKITAETSDEELMELIVDWGECANNDLNENLHPNLISYLMEFRQNLRNEDQ